jgi:hypothetical protein
MRSVSDGRSLLREPGLNRGTAFTARERAGLEGLLSAAVLAPKDQAKRAYEECAAQPTDRARNGYLAAPHDRKEVPTPQVDNLRAVSATVAVPSPSRRRRTTSRRPIWTIRLRPFRTRSATPLIARGRETTHNRQPQIKDTQ